MLVAAVALWVQLRFKPALVVSTAVNYSLAVSTRSSGVARDWKMRADRRVLTFCAIPKLEFGASFESFV